MNTRIQELATQAKASVPADIYGPTKWIEVYNEKFAELIVKECASIADTDLLQKGVGCGYITYTAGERIKKHFGVK